MDIINSDLDEDLKNSWGTDPDVFNAMDREFNFELDAASNAINNKCDLFLDKDENSLTVDWFNHIRGFHQKPKYTAWINPPYERGSIKQFMKKAIEQKNRGVTTVMLVPATLDAQWLPINDISEIRIITGGRLCFYHPITNKKVSGNTKGSMFVIFRPSKMPCHVRLIDRNELLKCKA